MNEEELKMSIRVAKSLLYCHNHPKNIMDAVNLNERELLFVRTIVELSGRLEDKNDF